MEKKLIELIEKYYSLNKEITMYMEEKNLYNGDRDAKIKEALDEMKCFRVEMRDNVLDYMNNYITQQAQHDKLLDVLADKEETLEDRLDRIEVSLAELKWEMFKWGFAGTLSAIGVGVAIISLLLDFNMFL